MSSAATEDGGEEIPNLDDEPVAPESWVVDTPAVFLSPSWGLAGEISSASEHGQAFDVPVGILLNFTLCACVKRPADLEGSGRILQKGELPNGWLFSAAGVVKFAAGASPTAPAPAPKAETEEPVEGEAEVDLEPAHGEVVGRSRIDDGQWHHVAVVARDGVVSLFVDGNQDSDETAMEVPTAPNSDLTSGFSEDEFAGEAGLRDVQAYYEAFTEGQLSGLESGSKELGTGLRLSMSEKEVVEYRRLKASAPVGEDPEGIGAAARELLAAAAELPPDPLQERTFQKQVTLNLFEDLMACSQTICLTPRKTAVMVAILRNMLAKMYSKSKTSKRVGEKSSLYECFQEFKRLMLAHTYAAATSAKPIKELREAPRPEKATLGVFSLAEVRLLSEFLTGTLFQHFLLYQCVLVHPQDRTVKHIGLRIDQPHPPHDLMTAKLLPKNGSSAAGTTRGAESSAVSESRSKDTVADDAPADAADAGASLEQTLASMPKDLNVDDHHKHATRAAEAAAKSYVKRHDEEVLG
mmetsp:Transcript_70956/g.125463  ORF Transcript_70956/g.125463 Transcript_70956/m.125463 type:complete len:523 (+) Transcript_70956:70-1638(+)